MNFHKRRRKELNSWFCSSRANCSSEEKALPIQVKNKLNNLYEIRSSSASDVRRTKRVRASRTRTKRCSKIGKHASADFRRQSFILTETAFRNKNYLSAHFRFCNFAISSDFRDSEKPPWRIKRDSWNSSFIGNSYSKPWCFNAPRNESLFSKKWL
jgi:hypothetical protein